MAHPTSSLILSPLHQTSVFSLILSSLFLDSPKNPLQQLIIWAPPKIIILYSSFLDSLQRIPASLYFKHTPLESIILLQRILYHSSTSNKLFPSFFLNFLPCQVKPFYNSSNQQALLQTILRSSSFLKIHLSSLVFSLAEGVKNKGLSKI